MSNRKNKDKVQEKLISADREKSSDAARSSVNNDFVEKYTKARGSVSSVFTKKSKFPIGLDIFISILLIAIVAALVVGAYFLIIKFDDSHDNAVVEYVLLVDKAQVEGIEKGNNAYIDRNGSVVYFGNIIDINDNIVVANENVAVTEFVAITVRADAQYRDDEGYTINGEKIAVGRSISLHIKDRALACEIIELAAAKRK